MAWSMMLLFNSCEDLLPPYVGPDDLLSSTVEITTEPKIFYTHQDFNSPEYWLPTLRFSSSSAIIRVVVRNTFDDPLEDVANIQGAVTIWWEDKPEHRVSVPLYQTDLIYGEFNPATNSITLTPEDSLVFRTTWFFRDSESMPFFYHFPKVDRPIPGRQTFLREHQVERMRAQASITVFSGVNPSRSREFEFDLQFEGTITPPP